MKIFHMHMLASIFKELTRWQSKTLVVIFRDVVGTCTFPIRFSWSRHCYTSLVPSQVRLSEHKLV